MQKIINMLKFTFWSRVGFVSSYFTAFFFFWRKFFLFRFFLFLLFFLLLLFLFVTEGWDSECSFSFGFLLFSFSTLSSFLLFKRPYCWVFKTAPLLDFSSFNLTFSSRFLLLGKFLLFPKIKISHVTISFFNFFC